MAFASNLQGRLRWIPACRRLGSLLPGLTLFAGSAGLAMADGYPPPPGPYPFADKGYLAWPAPPGDPGTLTTDHSNRSSGQVPDFSGAASPFSANNLFGVERAPGPDPATPPPSLADPPARHPSAAARDSMPPRSSDFSMDFKRKPDRYGTARGSQGFAVPPHPDRDFAYGARQGYSDHYPPDYQYLEPQAGYGQIYEPQQPQPTGREGWQPSAPAGNVAPGRATEPRSSMIYGAPREQPGSGEQRSTPVAGATSPGRAVAVPDASPHPPAPDTAVFRPPGAN